MTASFSVHRKRRCIGIGTAHCKGYTGDYIMYIYRSVKPYLTVQTSGYSKAVDYLLQSNIFILLVTKFFYYYLCHFLNRRNLNRWLVICIRVLGRPSESSFLNIPGC